MAMLRLIARDSGWLKVPPEVVEQDELRSGSRLKVEQLPELQENVYAIATPNRNRIARLEALLAGAADETPQMIAVGAIVASSGED